MNYKLSIIAAIAKNRAMGNKGRVPWHIKEDLIRFKEKTIGHIVIMGRKTFDSMLEYYKKSGRPIPSRVHIIVTRNNNYKVEVPNCYVANSIDEAIKIAKTRCYQSNQHPVLGCEIFVAGGGQIYKQAIDMADKLYLTIVEGKFEADTFFPDYSDFKKVIYEEKRESKGLKYRFLELEI